MRTQINTNIISEENSESVILGNPITYFGESIVAFIKILGYTESLLNNWGVQGDSPIIRLLEIREKQIASITQFPECSRMHLPQVLHRITDTKQNNSFCITWNQFPAHYSI